MTPAIPLNWNLAVGGVSAARRIDHRHDHCRHILTAGHPRKIDLGDRPVRIEDDAWLAAGSIVMRGVCIGRGAIVGAGSVVTHDVPAFTVVAGNPARVIRTLDMDDRETLTPHRSP